MKNSMTGNNLLDSAIDAVLRAFPQYTLIDYDPATQTAELSAPVAFPIHGPTDYSSYAAVQHYLNSSVFVPGIASDVDFDGLSYFVILTAKL